MREYGPDAHIEAPQDTIQIRRDINDGPIPGFKFDHEKFEVRCSWKELFSAFYGEEFLYHTILGNAVAQREPWLEGLKLMVDRKEMDPQQVIMKALNGSAEDNSTARKMARRSRVKRQFQSLDGTEWDFARDGDEEDEERISKSLQQARQFATFEEWSDDDGEEEDEDEDDDGDSGDGWQTDDGSEAEGSVEED